MLDNLLVIESKGQNPEFPEGPEWIRWTTCLRQLAIGVPHYIPNAKPGCRILSGQEAYTYLLEVICGLHSPVVGETEVMGQFKELVEGNNNPSFSKLFRQLLTDSKLIRKTILKDMGSKSYGSLLRKFLKDSSGVTLLGSGKLAEELLPWLSEVQVELMCRNQKKGELLKKKFPFVTLKEISLPTQETVILAAPLKAGDLEKFMVGVTKVVDLRGGSDWDPIKTNEAVEIVSLQDFFKEFELVKNQSYHKVLEAKSRAKLLSEKFFLSSENRPFGWEDLCG
jgi:glutamyl-tRNA reductase